jgi:hypothetical protein
LTFGSRFRGGLFDMKLAGLNMLLIDLHLGLAVHSMLRCEGCCHYRQ